MSERKESVLKTDENYTSIVTPHISHSRISS
jgi:hypothetical protein